MAEPMRFRAPTSKSLTQRGLILAALAEGESRIVDPLECDDSKVLGRSLERLGVRIERSPTEWRVRGGAIGSSTEPLWCGDAGTALRFSIPLALVASGPIVLDGSPRLRERPVAPLLQSMRTLGVRVDALEKPDCLPLRLQRAGDPGTHVAVDASQSSQFASGLMMVAPRLARGLDVELTLAGGAEEPVSQPYLAMTVVALRAFGALVEERGRTFHVATGGLRGTTFVVEGDWSGAAFLLAGGLVAGRTVLVENVAPDSVQSDRAMAAFVEELGRARDHRFDLFHCPDLIAPLAAACVFASHPSEIVNVAHARLKESDRVAVLAAQFRRAGVDVEERPDGLRVRPGNTLKPAALDPHGDHRMAMAFGLLSLREPGIDVLDRGCVAKSFPRFWEELERFR